MLVTGGEMLRAVARSGVDRNAYDRAAKGWQQWGDLLGGCHGDSGLDRGQKAAIWLEVVTGRCGQWTLPPGRGTGAGCSSQGELATSPLHQHFLERTLELCLQPGFTPKQWEFQP